MFPGAVRCIVPFLFACLTLPQAALADQSTDFSKAGETLSGSNAGLALTGPILDAIATVSGTPVMGSLGVIPFSTGALMSGSQIGRAHV